MKLKALSRRSFSGRGIEMKTLKQLAWFFGPQIVIGLLFFAMAGCSGDCGCKNSPSKTTYHKPTSVADPEWKPGDAEALGPGYVRKVNWQSRSILYETDQGFIKTLDGICGNGMLPVWEGMHLYQFNYHWYQDRMGNFSCFGLDYIGHDPARDYTISVSPTPANAAGGSK
jgi:hypothetical protein